MHEMSLINSLMTQIKKVAEENHATAISAVQVEIGALAHISADHFREHFIEAAAGTMAEQAALNIEMKSDIHDPRAQDIILKKVSVVS